MVGTTLAAAINQTNTTGVPDQQMSIGDVVWLRALRYTLYAMIFLISLPGNLMVCAIITRRRKMKTVTNYLILNLAISDVLYTIYVPLDIAVIETDRWPFGAVFCKLFYPLMTLSICASALTLMCLALTRFWAVVFPFRRQVSVLQIKITIIVIWLLSIVAVTPYAVSLELTDVNKDCEESSWPNPQSKKFYTLALFLYQFVIPLTAITFAYTMVGVELKKGDHRTDNQSLERARHDESRKVIKMLIFVTVIFAVCNLPTSIMWMINDFGTTITGFNDIVFFFNILDFSNAAADPCIYLTCNDEFRQEFHRYWARVKRKVCRSGPQSVEDPDFGATRTSMLLKGNNNH